MEKQNKQDLNLEHHVYYAFHRVIDHVLPPNTK
jgi:hypothetical protein